MAYPTNSAALALDQIDQQLVNLKRRAEEAVATLASQAVVSEYILNIHGDIRATHASLTSLQSTPGLQSHARAMKDAPALDVAAEFAAVKQKIDAIADWIEANMPTSGGWLQHIKFENSQIAYKTFGSSTTTPLRVLLNELAALIQE